MRHALDHELVSVKTIFTCVSILLKLEEFEIAARVLESGRDEFLKKWDRIPFDYVFASVVGHKTRNNLREIADIRQEEHESGLLKMCVQAFFWYSLYVCYKNLGNGGKLQRCLSRMVDHFLSNFGVNLTLLLGNNHGDIDNIIDIQLLFEMYENQQEWRLFYHEYYNRLISLKMSTIALLANNSIKTWTWNLIDPSNPPFRRLLFVSSNDHIRASLYWFVDSCDSPLNTFYYDQAKEIGRQAVTTSDRVYYAQVLIVMNEIEQAISILNAIIEEEGDYSLSVVIWPKPTWQSNFLDANLREELIDLDLNYIVFPSNVYARYLLVNVYNSLGQMEQCERNLYKFLKLREWYSSFTALNLAPMSNIMFNILKK